MRNAIVVSLGRPFAALGFIVALSGCAMSERAEAIYLQQHRTSTALTETIVAAETEDPALADRLYETESAFDDACAPLREASYRKMNGTEIDSELELAIVDSLDTCAAKTQEVEALLWRIDPETARYFIGASDIATIGIVN